MRSSENNDRCRPNIFVYQICLLLAVECTPFRVVENFRYKLLHINISINYEIKRFAWVWAERNVRPLLRCLARDDIRNGFVWQRWRHSVLSVCTLSIFSSELFLVHRIVYNIISILVNVQKLLVDYTDSLIVVFAKVLAKRYNKRLTIYLLIGGVVCQFYRFSAFSINIKVFFIENMETSRQT